MTLGVSRSGLRGVLSMNDPLAPYTTWRVGGPADRLYRPADVQDLAQFLARLPAGEPVLWLGLGSNLLVRDGGVRGTVIATHGALGGLSRVAQDRIHAGAGVPCAKLARFSVRQSLTGGEFLAGIPGTLGGALTMNAGAFGGQTWDLVERVETVDRGGRLRVREVREFHVGYREVRGPWSGTAPEWFTAAWLRLQAAADDQGAVRIKNLLAQRSRTQPVGLPSAGSVFRNPPGDHAARLIEAAGLKGLCVGGACVSQKHANFIVTTGSATAQDVESLIERVRDQVERTLGVRLVPEVHVVGERL